MSQPAIAVIGPFKGASGYDRCTTEFVREFVRQGVNVQLTNVRGWSVELPPGLRDTWFDSLGAPVAANSVLHFTMPNHVRPQPGKRNINYTMFEAERIPRLWASCAALPELIVVPTESSFNAWTLSHVPEGRLRICPLGVDGKYFASPASPAPVATSQGRPLKSFRYRFLNIAELRPRKNHLGLLRTWMRATKPDDEAALVLKVSVFQRGVIEDFQADLADLQQSMGRSLSEAAPVILIPTLLTNEMIRSLYCAATHYVSLSCGEGWDQPMMEAAAAGLTLIAPRHSAYLSYLKDEDSFLIPAKLTPARFEGRMGRADWAFFAGVNWWKPDEDAAVAVLRSIISGEAQPKQSPQARIINDFTWEKAARRLLEIVL